MIFMNLSMLAAKKKKIYWLAESNTWSRITDEKKLSQNLKLKLMKIDMKSVVNK